MAHPKKHIMRTSVSKLLAGLLLLLLGSCYYDELIEEEVPDIPDTEEISFATDIEPLFTACTACHDGSVANPDLRAGNAYDALVPAYVVPGDAEGSEFYQKLPGVGHPFDPGVVLTSSEIALIKAWIDRGAEDN